MVYAHIPMKGPTTCIKAVKLPQWYGTGSEIPVTTYSVKKWATFGARACAASPPDSYEEASIPK
eukprot:2014235-Rhodomonas_salina.1